MYARSSHTQEVNSDHVTESEEGDKRYLQINNQLSGIQ